MSKGGWLSLTDSFATSSSPDNSQSVESMLPSKCSLLIGELSSQLVVRNRYGGINYFYEKEGRKEENNFAFSMVSGFEV